MYNADSCVRDHDHKTEFLSEEVVFRLAAAMPDCRGLCHKSLPEDNACVTNCIILKQKKALAKGSCIRASDCLCQNQSGSKTGALGQQQKAEATEADSTCVSCWTGVLQPALYGMKPNRAVSAMQLSAANDQKE